MKRRMLYITVSVFVIVLAIALLSWAVFVGRQQQELQQDAANLGYFGGAPEGTRGVRGVFDGIFNNEPESAASQPDPEPILQQLYNLPTSGYVKKRANAIRFVDRATGHVFEKELSDGTTTRVDQTTIPQVYNAVFTNDGDGVVRQYVGDRGDIISTYSILTNKEIPGISLPVNILEIKTSRNEDRMSVLYRTQEGSSVSILNGKGEVEKAIFDSNLRGWALDWKGEDLLITQKPSGSLPGSSYLFDIVSGARMTALQQVPGLETKLSPDGQFVLYSKIEQTGTPVLFSKNVTTGLDIPLNIAGFASKCAWLPTSSEAYCALPAEFQQAQYPDAWYQGDIHFRDSLWKANVATGLVEHVFSPAVSNGVSLDMIDLTVSADGGTLFFINNTDQTLWSVTFPEREADESPAANEAVE